MNKGHNKGFTLIELLVVIAIIGILASVVLASLNSARNKGADSAVKANLSGVRAQAEIWYDGNSSRYNVDGATALSGTGAAGAVCGVVTGMYSDTNIKNALAQVAAQMAGTATMTCTTAADGQKWAISVTVLKGGGSWCVDNSGWAKAGLAGATGVCA